MGAVKPASPPPRQPNGLPYESLGQLFRAIIAVPKAQIDKREEEWKQEHGKPKRRARRKKSKS
jgi:hypothetical protein